MGLDQHILDTVEILRVDQRDSITEVIKCWMRYVLKYVVFLCLNRILHCLMYVFQDPMGAAS